MKEIKEQKVWICPDDLDEIVHGIYELSAGLCNSAYWRTPKGVLTCYDDGTEEQNAAQFIGDHYAVTSGALRLIAASANILSQTLANGDLHFIGTDQFEKAENNEEVSA